LRTTRLEVDINKFNKNIKNIKKYVGNKKIMPIIKANAYGTHINKRLDVIDQFDIVSVAFAMEGVDLRKLGYKKEIFILNQPSIDELDEILDNDLIIGLSDYSFLEKLDNIKKDIKVHLEIETGMNRTGIKLDELNKFINKIINNNHIIVEGIYTHLSSADNDIEYTERQYNVFKEAVNIIKSKINNIKYIHISASNGIINLDDDICNLVRPGIIMYGYYSCEEIKNKIKLEPICKLKTKITYLKECEKDEAIGYSKNFITPSKMKIATIPLGYADGLKRELSNKGKVVVNNKICNIIGNICMDSCMIDVSKVDNVNVGTEVYIWDNELIIIDDIANITNTINYEILSTVSYRVYREFIN